MVVDCAPTAETIRLLSLPDVLGRYMERVFPTGRRVNRVVSPLVSRVTTLPVAGDEVFAATERFYDRLDGVRDLLTDGRRTSVRLVVNPERMVIAEARRTHTYLSLFGYHVDAVIANRLLPDDVSDPWFAALEGAARRAPRGHRGGLRPGAGAAGAAAAGRAGRRSTRCGASPTRCTATRTRRPGSAAASRCACAAAATR